jgi:hypothetical protein
MTKARRFPEPTKPSLDKPFAPCWPTVNSSSLWIAEVSETLFVVVVAGLAYNAWLAHLLEHYPTA